MIKKSKSSILVIKDRALIYIKYGNKKVPTFKKQDLDKTI